MANFTNLKLYPQRKRKPDPLNWKLEGRDFQGRPKKEVVSKGADIVGYFYRLEQVQSDDKG